MKTKLFYRRKNDIRNQAIERFMIVFATIEPLTTIPQIVLLYTTKNAIGLSLSMWVLYVVAAVVWLFYGIHIKSKALIASSVFWILTEIPVVIGILIY